MERQKPFGDILKAKNTADNTRIETLTYLKPTQGYDWSITNCGSGKAKMTWQGNGKEMYIGEMKIKLQYLIESLDKAAESWGVPANLDGRGRKLAS